MRKAAEPPKTRQHPPIQSPREMSRVKHAQQMKQEEQARQMRIQLMHAQNVSFFPFVFFLSLFAEFSYAVGEESRSAAASWPTG